MIRTVLAVLAIGLITATANGQVGDSNPDQDGSTPAQPELLRQIALYEASEQSAERTHPGMESMVRIYTNLSVLYEDLGILAKAEEVTKREIAALRSGPQNKVAEAMGHLAMLHIAMAEPRDAERDELEALRIREMVGDPVGTAQTWNDLADVYAKQHQYKKALDYAQRAMPVLADDPKVDPADRIAVRQTMAFARCGLKQCGAAIVLLKDSLELQKRVYGADSLIVGTGYYLLGHAYWQNGEMDQAAELMARGTTRMKSGFGWGHTIYLSAMAEYAKFLRQNRQMDAAASAEREVKMANSVVDAHSLAASTVGLAMAGPR